MTRTNTADRRNPDGSTTVTVKRACNGCHRLIGDATTEELEAGMNGRPLPDVTVECGCAIVDAWTDQDTGIVWLCGLGQHHDCEGYACPCACHALTPELCEVLNEKARAEEKFGLQLGLPDGTAATEWDRPAVDMLRDQVDRHAKDGTLTWREILTEEIAEAFAEQDPERLRTELIQVAAVALRWVDAIDARAPRVDVTTVNDPAPRTIDPYGEPVTATPWPPREPDDDAAAAAGIELISAERRRQIRKGFDTDHDRTEHDPEALVRAGIGYALASEHWLPWWPLDDADLTRFRDQTRVERLTKAGALLAAAIDLDLALIDQEDA